jgi:dTMP kinase
MILVIFGKIQKLANYLRSKEMSSKSRNRECRRERAKERFEETSKRTPQEQLKRLDLMFGEGQGAQKERAKLQRRIEEQSRARVEAAKKKEVAKEEEEVKEEKVEAKPKSKSEARRLKIQKAGKK